jgi:hypothetical protein
VIEAAPRLVGTLCRYLEARTGLVFLYRDEQFALELMNPIWVNDTNVPVDESLTLEAIDGGVIGQVFRSGVPVRLDSIWSNRSRCHPSSLDGQGWHALAGRVDAEIHPDLVSAGPATGLPPDR